MGKVLLAITLLLAVAFVAEGQYRRAVITPQFLQLLAEQPALKADLRTVADTKAYFPIANVGNALTPQCVDGPYGCFSWDRFGNVGSLLAISPTSEILGMVRVLERCDFGACVALDSGSILVREASVTELSEYSDALSYLEDGCVERSSGPYAALVCSFRETVGGLPTYSAYSIGEPYLKALSALSPNKMRSIASEKVNFVTGTTITSGELKPYLDEVSN